MEFYKVNPRPTDGNSVSVFGKNPDYVELNFGSGASTANILSAWNLGPNGAWAKIIQTVEQVSTIEVLGTLQANCVLLSQNGGNANIGCRMLVTGVNAANATALQTAIQSLGVIATANANIGFSNVNVAAVTVSAVTIGAPATGPMGGQTSTFVF